MKVIANTENDGALIQVNQAELAQLCGYKSQHERDYKKPNIGDEINTARFFNVIMSAKDAQNRIKSSTQQLKNVTDLLDQITLPEISEK